jgi:hypothetical protein
MTDDFESRLSDQLLLIVDEAPTISAEEAMSRPAPSRPALRRLRPVPHRGRPSSRAKLLLRAAVVVCLAGGVTAVVVDRTSSPPATTVPSTTATTSTPVTSAPGTTPVTTSTSTPTTTSSVPTTTIPTGTEQISYQPFVGDAILPTLKVVARQSGRCDRYGGGAAGRYYYRCFGPGSVRDPCFAGPQGTSAQLVCPEQPLSDNVALFTVTSLDTSSPAWTSVRPWAMELPSGQVCLFVSAAWSGLGPYQCAGHPAGAVADCRQPAPASPWWTTTCQASLTQSSPFVAYQVQVVWT